MPPVAVPSQNHSGRCFAQQVRAGTHHVHDLSDGARSRQGDCFADGPVLEALGEQHGPRPPAPLADRRPDLVELGAGGDAGLVAEHVLAGAERGDRDRGPLARDAREHDQWDRLIGEDGIGAAFLRRLLPAGVHSDQPAAGCVRDCGRTRSNQPVDHLEQVQVIGPDDREPHCRRAHDTDLVAASKSSAQLFASLVSSCTIDSCSIVPHGPSWRG